MFYLLRWILCIFCIFPLGAFGFQINWSGYSVGSLYLIQPIDTKDSSWVYKDRSLGYFVDTSLQGQALLFDGVTLTSRVSFYENPPSSRYSSRSKGGFSKADIQNLSVQATHAYIKYASEFFEVEVGRMPFGFGLGMTYTRGEHPIDPVFDTRDAILFRTRWNDLTLTPLIAIRDSKRIEAILNLSYVKEDYKVEMLYNTAVYDESKQKNVVYLPTTLNFYLQYQKDPFSLNVELGSYRNEGHFTGLAGVFEGQWKTQLFKKDVNLGLFGGYASGPDPTKSKQDLSYEMNTALDSSFYLVELISVSEKREGSFKDSIFFTPIVSYFSDVLNTNIDAFYTAVFDSEFSQLKGHELVVQGSYTTQGWTFVNRIFLISHQSTLQTGFLTRFIMSF